MYYPNFAGVLLIRPFLVILSGEDAAGRPATAPLGAATTRRFVEFFVELREAFRLLVCAASRDFSEVVASPYCFLSPFCSQLCSPRSLKLTTLLNSTLSSCLPTSLLLNFLCCCYRLQVSIPSFMGSLLLGVVLFHAFARADV